MGLFKRAKQDREDLAGAMDQFRHAQDLAAESTARFTAETGMDPATVMRRTAELQASGGMSDALAYRDRAQRVYQRGVEMPATLTSVSIGAADPLLGGMPAQMELTVEPPGGAPYAVSTSQPVADALAQALTPGARLTVKVDPDDPQSLLVWGTAETADAPPATGAEPTDRIGRLGRLQELRSTGALSEVEFQEAKAKILAE